MLNTKLGIQSAESDLNEGFHNADMVLSQYQLEKRHTYVAALGPAENCKKVIIEFARSGHPRT